MFLLFYGKEPTHIIELHAEPFTYIFIAGCIKKKKTYCKDFYHHERNLLEVMTLPAGYRETETWDQWRSFEGMTEISSWIDEESGARLLAMHFQVI